MTNKRDKGRECARERFVEQWGEVMKRGKRVEWIKCIRQVILVKLGTAFTSNKGGFLYIFFIYIFIFSRELRDGNILNNYSRECRKKNRN